MIRLAPRPCPIELTAVVQAALTAEYIADKTRTPWKKTYIERELRLMSNDKCCYCECHIYEESKYMEVEHFYAKQWHEALVVEWDNLLPACKRCNIHKSSHDCKIEPIVHPVNDEPRDHFKWRAYRFYDKTSLGKKTIEVIDLNDRERLVNKRFDIGERIQQQLDFLEDDVLDFENGTNTSPKRVNKICRWVKNILAETQPDREFSATAATVLLNEPRYQNIKTILQGTKLWDIEMTTLELTAQNLALDVF